MADNHSFDVVSKIDMPEVNNAVNQAAKELLQRYDLKNSNSSIELNQKEYSIVLKSSDEYMLKSVNELLRLKLVKRNVSPKALNYGDVEDSAGSSVCQKITLQNGIPQDKAKQMVKDIKAKKMKVQSQIQEDQVRVIAKKIDDLQEVMRLLKEKDYDIHLEFINYR